MSHVIPRNFILSTFWITLLFILKDRGGVRLFVVSKTIIPVLVIENLNRFLKNIFVERLCNFQDLFRYFACLGYFILVNCPWIMKSGIFRVWVSIAQVYLRAVWTGLGWQRFLDEYHLLDFDFPKNVVHFYFKIPLIQKIHYKLRWSSS